MERVVASKQCRELVDSGVDLDTLVEWLNQQLIDSLVAAAQDSFLGVPGIESATELHDWVDAQLDAQSPS